MYLNALLDVVVLDSTPALVPTEEDAVRRVRGLADLVRALVCGDGLCGLPRRVDEAVEAERARCEGAGERLVAPDQGTRGRRRRIVAKRTE